MLQCCLGQTAPKAHSDQVTAKVSKGLGLIRRLRRNQLPRSFLTLYHSIVKPYISYGCVIWTSGFYTNLKQVQVLQNKVVVVVQLTFEPLKQVAVDDIETSSCGEIPWFPP